MPPQVEVAVHKAYARDFERVYPLLATHDPKVSRHEWRRLFEDHWRSPEDHCGYILVHREKVVGFLGLIFSTRPVLGQPHKFCNITSWIVDPEHRQKSLYLYFPVLKLRDYTITNITATESVYRISKDTGFQDLDHYMRVLPPLPGLSGLLPGKRCRLVSDPAVIPGYLQGDELTIFRDHAPFACSHFLLVSKTGRCYVILSRIIKKGVPLAFVQYIGDPQIFFEHIHRVKLRVCLKMKAAALVIDERFLQGRRLSRSFRIKPERHRLYKSALRPEEIDNLYSELILLNI
jgi:hypothetical protein